MANKTESEDLNLHVQLCTERYTSLENKFHVLDARITKVENQLDDLKTTFTENFSEIKLLLEKQNSSKQIQIIATFGTIITAVLGFIGYVVTKH